MSTATSVLPSRLDVKDAAAYADMHPGSIRRLLEAGALHGTQPVKGGRWRVRPECIDAYLDGVVCVHRQNVTDIESRRAS